MTMRLWLIRHAKSSWAERGQPDHERSLNKRGETDGPRMAAWLGTQAYPADWIWSSDAVRARATAEFVAQGFARSSADITLHAALYHANPSALLDVLRQTPPGTRNVALVAHNPGLTYLVNELAGAAVTDNLPTFGIARFELPASWQGDWSELRGGVRGCTLELLVSPKTL